MSELKPIKLWGKGGPNPPKVAILLQELGIPYEAIAIGLEDIKKPDYLSINPNGRLPAIQDPNTDLTLWESGAIVEYLIERYDKDQALSFPPGTAEYYQAKQWLFFQTTGQGPYFGQAAWFKRLHQEQVPTAIKRYADEVNRVTGVLEGYLAARAKDSTLTTSNDGPWLVGDKVSYVDLAFITWQIIITKFVDQEEYDVKNFPNVEKWLGKMMARESVKDVLAEFNILHE
jgi:glutathione S-transferase